MTYSLWHLTCHHESYRLNCEAYEALLARAEFRCELRGCVSDRLWIDHDHCTDEVRGLVCPKCNAHMRRVDNGERPVDAQTRRYMTGAVRGTARKSFRPFFSGQFVVVAA